MGTGDLQKLGLMAGEWVDVRSKDEILATLDKTAGWTNCHSLPQMFQYCGQRLRVIKRAHRLCDTQFATEGRAMNDAVVIEGLRCDGQNYGGCEMGCVLIWKEAWLKRSSESAAMTATPAALGTGCTEAELQAATVLPPLPDAIALGPRYVCQATQLTPATQPLSFWSIPHFVEDYKSGNEPIGKLVSGIFVAVYYNLAESGLGFGSVMRWAYDKVQGLRGKTLYVHRKGHLPLNGKTPTLELNLRPGELVRTKSHNEILDTVNYNLVNRGMGFHPELVPYCGRVFRVKFRVTKIINEKTGHLIELKNPCIVLERC